MRKDRYLQQVIQYLPELRKIAIHVGLCKDDANEVLSKCLENMLTQRKYIIVEATKLKAFLLRSIRYAVQDYKKSLLMRMRYESRLPDPEEGTEEQSLVVIQQLVNIDPVEEQECPFCFNANLNKYGACAMCHTILPSYLRIQRTAVVITKESLAVEFDFNTKIDVQKAIARLTPFEQRVVKACGLGNDSLENFAYDNNFSKSTIVRTWVKAKAKLQEYLNEYAPKRVSKRGESAFRKALQSIENQQKI